MASQRRELENTEQMEVDEKGGRRGFGDYVESPEVDRRITRKCDFHILPWIFVLWLLAFIDRSNIGVYIIYNSKSRGAGSRSASLRRWSTSIWR